MIVLTDIKWMFLSISIVLLTANRNNVASLILKHLRLLGEKEHVYSSNIYAYLILQSKSLCQSETSCTVLFSNCLVFIL